MFRSSIQTFLREEGFAPSIDSDGSLCFKKEGESYWIDVTGDKPFYVTFHRGGLGTKDASEIAVLKAINEVNIDIRAIKCCYNNGGVSFSIETYCYVAEDFKYAFYDYLSILQLAETEVKNAYSKYNTSSSNSPNKPYGQENSSSAPVYSSSVKTIPVNGPVLETQYHKWWVTSIEIGPKDTKVTNIVSPKTPNTYVFSTKDEYIEDCDTGKKYYIQSSTIGIEPKRTVIYPKTPKSFTDTYPALPISVKRINIWSGNDYCVKNLQIR